MKKVIMLGFIASSMLMPHVVFANCTTMKNIMETVCSTQGKVFCDMQKSSYQKWCSNRNNNNDYGDSESSSYERGSRDYSKPSTSSNDYGSGYNDSRSSSSSSRGREETESSFLPTASHCADIEWRMESWAQLTLTNNCPARVSAKVTFSDGSRGSVSCNANKICKDSHPKKKGNLSFDTCFQYTDYKLQKLHGRCR